MTLQLDQCNFMEHDQRLIGWLDPKARQRQGPSGAEHGIQKTLAHQLRVRQVLDIKLVQQVLPGGQPSVMQQRGREDCCYLGW